MKIIRNTDFDLVTESGSELDRLSNLPDEILKIILSFIDDRNLIVQTSVLSQRWKDLWVSMPKFDFDFSSYGGFQSEKTPKIFNFPDRLLNSKTLRELSIRAPLYGIRLPRPFALPNLNILNLEWFRFNYDSDSDSDDGYEYHRLPKEPFSGFSELEKLTIFCAFEVDDLIISAPKLKILELSHLNLQSKRETKMKEICAPELTSLRYGGPYALTCEKLDCPRLEKLYFCVWAIYYSREKLIKMLQIFGNYAKFVTFSTDTIEILAADSRLLDQSPSPFPYLKSVKYFRGNCYQRDRKYYVPQIVVNYLTKGSSYDVSFSYDSSSYDF